MDEQAFANIGAALSDITAAHTVVGAAGTFSYTPEALRGLINEWTSLAADYRKSRHDSGFLVKVEGPGIEYASQSHATMANISGQSYLDSLDMKATYCEAEAQKLQDTLDGYLGVEQHSISVMHQVDSQHGI